MICTDLTVKGRDKLVCQDSSYSFNKDSIYILAVSDGLGSHKHSHLGSRKILSIFKYNCDIEIKLLDSHYTYKEVEKMLNKIYQNTISQWEKWVYNQSSKELDCTFSVIFYFNGYVLYRSIGDSILFFIDKDWNFSVIQSPENVRDSFGGTPTLFSRGKEGYRNYNYFDDSLLGIVLCTDGLEEVIIRDRENPLAREVHHWFINTFKLNYPDKNSFISVLTSDFISQNGETKGDDVGFGYVILE